MFITLEVLSDNLDFKSLTNAIEFCKQNNIFDLEDKEFINKLIENNKLYWANDTIGHLLNEYNCVKYALFAADEIIEYFENNFKKSNLFRETIEEIRSYINDPDNIKLDCSSDTLMNPTWRIITPELRHAAYCMVFTANTYRAKLSAIGAIEAAASAQAYISIKDISKPKYLDPETNYLKINKYRLTYNKTMTKFINYGVSLL